MLKRAIVLISVLVLISPVLGQEPFEGETLISPMDSWDSDLLDMDGSVVKTWHGSQRPKSMAYLLADGSILRPCRDTGGVFTVPTAGGRIQRIDADDTIVWDFYFSDENHQQHHDIQPLPNGNVLLLAWEIRTLAEAIAMGSQYVTGDIWPTLIVEVEPMGATGGNIVWEWHFWDHLIQDVDPGTPNYGVVADHPELMNINCDNLGTNGDWIHGNAIDYHPDLDQIVFSARKTDEVYIIDHSTTTEEAAGHSGGNSGMGGDLLYRWGNPQVYGRGGVDDQYFFAVHGVNWIDVGLPGAGNLLCLNNGDRPGTGDDYSTAVEIVPPLAGSGTYTIEPDSAFGPTAPVWTYGEPGGFYGGPTHCGAFRLPNGNTLITATEDGYVFEVSEAGVIEWEYDHPSRIARAQRYWDDLTPAPPVEEALALPSFRLGPIYPNPFTPTTVIRYELAQVARVSLAIYDARGRLVRTLIEGESRGRGPHRVVWDGRNTTGQAAVSGVYFARIETHDFAATRKLTLLR
jgi:hypothetical protein